MLEIIIMVLVVGWFYRTAKQIGANGFLWGAMGALSYYVPMLLCSLFIIPVFLGPFVTRNNQSGIQLLDILLSVAIGIACCVALRQILKSKVRTHYETQTAQPPQ